MPRWPRMTLVERFWAKVQRGRPGECWPWLGAIQSGGYGSFFAAGRIVKAHRFSYELAKGPVPPGLHVCHTCDSPPCVNPRHLFVASHATNMRDMSLKGRAAWGSHPGRTELTAEQVVTLRREYSRGTRPSVLAARYRIHPASVGRIVRGDRWPWLPLAPRRPEHGNAKLTASQVRDIQRRATRGRYSALGREFGVTYQTISAIANGQTWRSLLGS